MTRGTSVTLYENCREDWDKCLVKQSWLDRDVEGGLFESLNKLTESMIPYADHLPIIRLLLQLAYFGHADADVVKTLQKEAATKTTAKHKWLTKVLKDRWSEVIADLHDLNQSANIRKEIHKKAFLRGQFTALCIRIVLKPADDHLLVDYFFRQEEVARLKVYANYLIENMLISTSASSFDFGEELDMWLSRSQVLKLGRAMEAEIAKGGKKPKSWASSAARVIRRKNKHHSKPKLIITEAIELIQKIEDDNGACARSQLLILGEIAVGEKCKDPKALLLRKCIQYREVLKSVGKIEELRDDREKFRVIQNATWWAKYFCQLFEMKKAIEDKSTDAAKLEKERYDLLHYLVAIHVTKNDVAFGGTGSEAWELERSYFGSTEIEACAEA